MRGLDIRCEFAILISIKPHLRALPIDAAMASDEKLNDILQEAYMDGQQEGFNSLVRPDLSDPPCMFQDEDFLLGSWQAGFRSGRDFRCESDFYASSIESELEGAGNGSIE